ncbi:hypothetical protein ACN9MZ_06485 [Pseudoduganella sp. S-14]|jgi:hypothetical protein|uniref:hypothetical protein n=1 Tax=Pseudoduganella sp. S-14 TaxID=3404065 RepID=UPI003CF522C4
MRNVDDHEVTKPEEVTHFVSGALLGVVIAVAITYNFDNPSLMWKVGVAVASILWLRSPPIDRYWQAIFGRVGFGKIRSNLSNNRMAFALRSPAAGYHTRWTPV